MSRTTANVIGGLGRLLIGLGLLVLLFAGFQLWGTGLAEAKAQRELEGEFAARLAAVRRLEVPPATEEVGDGEPDAASPIALRPDQVPDGGDAIGQLRIPAIGVTKTFVEGTTRDILRAGPGHYGSTPLPGQPGNAAIAGHRTTHGAPFFDIDQLQPGDRIEVETLQGLFTYEVEAHDDGSGTDVGHFIVDPSEVGVISDRGDNRLTLTACHPKYSAAQRIIVTATLTSEPAPATMIPARTEEAAFGDDRGSAAEPATGDVGSPESEGQELAAGADAGGVIPIDDSGVTRSLGWQPDYARPTALWAGMTALIAIAGWLLGHRWRRWPAYAMALPPFTLALFAWFTNLDKFIPAV